MFVLHGLLRNNEASVKLAHSAKHGQEHVTVLSLFPKLAAHERRRPPGVIESRYFTDLHICNARDTICIQTDVVVELVVQ